MDKFNLREWRKARNMTQAQLGEKLGVNKRTIINWEQGATAPPGHVVELACKALEQKKS